MPDLNEHQWPEWGSSTPREGLLAGKGKTNSRERARSEGRLAVHAHGLAKESETKGYKTEGRLYDQSHAAPTVTGYERAKKSYEDSQRYNDV